MARRYAAKPTPDASVTDAALDAMDADELRTLIRDIIPWFDDATHARLVNMLVLQAMRKAAEKRIAAVTENKRRRYYGHAASLALACAQVDGSPERTSWLAAIRDKYRRYPALQREFGER